MNKPQATVRFKDKLDRESFYIWIAIQGFSSLQAWFDAKRTENSSQENYDKSIPKVTDLGK